MLREEGLMSSRQSFWEGQEMSESCSLKMGTPEGLWEFFCCDETSFLNELGQVRGFMAWKTDEVLISNFCTNSGKVFRLYFSTLLRRLWIWRVSAIGILYFYFYTTQDEVLLLYCTIFMLTYTLYILYLYRHLYYREGLYGTWRSHEIGKYIQRMYGYEYLPQQHGKLWVKS